MEQEQNTSLFSLGLDGQASYTLKNAASWAKVLAVVGFIIAIIFILFGVMFSSIMANSGSKYYSDEMPSGTLSMAGTMGMLVYVIMGGLYGLSSYFALSFANKISRALNTNDQTLLNAGFAGARNYFAFWAIITIIMLLFLLLGFAGLAMMPR